MDSRFLFAILVTVFVGCSGTNFEQSKSDNNTAGFELAPEGDDQTPQTPAEEVVDNNNNGNDDKSHDDKKNEEHKNDHEEKQCKDNNHGHHGNGGGHTKNACKDVKVTDIIVNVDDVILKGHGVTTHSPATGMDQFSLVNDPLIVTPAANVSPHQIRLILNGSGNIVKDNQGNEFPLFTPSAQQTGLKIIMPHVSMQANTSYKVNYKLNIEKQVVNGGRKCLLKPVLKGIGIEPVGGTDGTTTGGTDGSSTDGSTTGGTDGSTTGGTDGSTTGSTDGGTTGATTGATTGTTTGTTTGGDLCQQCFACVTAGGTIQECTPPCSLDCF